MFTRCTQCMTVFHISAAELRAADGAVVCGECGATFDALSTLSETLPTGQRVPAPPPSAPPPPSASPHPVAAEAATAQAWAETPDEAWPEAQAEEEALPELADARDEEDFLQELESLIGSEESGLDEAAAGAPEDAPEDAGQIRAQATGPLDGRVEEDWEDHAAPGEPDAWHDEPAGFEDDGAPADAGDAPEETAAREAQEAPRTAREDIEDAVFGETFGDPFDEPFSEPFGTPFVGAEDGEPDGGQRRPEPAMGAEGAAVRTGELDDDAAEAARELAGEKAGEKTGDERRGRREPGIEASAEGDAEELPGFAAPAPRRRRGLKLTLALLALLCIGAAWAHAQRGMLLRHPAGEAVLGPVYSLLGLEAAPRWSPGEFRALKWEAGADPARADRLLVAIEFVNAAGFAQPYPLLRVVLEDRFGRRVGAHDIEPASYVEGYSRGRRMPAGGRLRSTLEVPDPGARAEGFRVDFCLQSGSEGLVCSTDTAR